MIVGAYIDLEKNILITLSKEILVWNYKEGNIIKKLENVH